jgi:choline dehydrogenase-like flavoprotein
MRNLSADVIVVGAGAGGGFITTALAEAGLSVLVLERGPWFDYTKDFPMRFPDWEKRRRPFHVGSFFSDPSIEATRGADVATQNLDLCSRSKLDRIEPRERRGSFRYQRVLGVGGSTLHYQGEAHRFPPHAFRTRSLFGYGLDWPLDYDELEPWYAWAEQWLGVAGAPGNPFKAPRGPFPTPAHELSTKSQWVQRGAERLGWSLLPNTLALPSRSYDGRTPCQHSGGCVLGCPFGAKSSVDLAVLPRALRTGRVRILDSTRVLKLETGPDGRIRGVVYVQAGVRKRATADRYVLAGGAVETPRLLLASQNGSHPDGVGNANDRVGRNLMETIFSVLTIQADRPVQAWKGQPIDARIWDFNHPLQDTQRSGFALGVSGTMTAYHGPLSYAQRLGGYGKQHKDAMRERFGRIVNLFGIAEHTPYEENRLLLGEEVDKDGVPKVRVSSDYRQRDLNSLRAMIGGLEALAQACEPDAIMDLYSTYSNSSTTHMAGTCLMGHDPEQSVTDAHGRVHGVENLYIADASVLPGQGMGDSPSLTIQALALRTADYMVKHKSGRV